MGKLAALLEPRTASVPRSESFERASRRLLLLAFFWIVAAASFSGSIGKWALHDSAILEAPKRFAIEDVLDGKAYRPFVYRELVPTIANGLDRAVTPATRNHMQALAERLSNTIIPVFEPELTFSKIRADQNPRYRFRYLIVLYLTFVSLVLSLFALRRACVECGVGSVAATLASAAFVLALPYFETVGGYYYDSWELLFCALAFLMALRGKAIWLVVIALVATFNKETFFFLLPSLYPLLRLRLTKSVALMTTAAAVAASAVVNLAVKAHFAGNPGDPAEFHLWQNLAAYARLRTYGRVEATYGVMGPGGLSLLTVGLVVLTVALGWRRCSLPLRQHLLIAAAITVPLFLAFCDVGELRNFSMLYVGFVVMIGYAIQGTGAGLARDAIRA